MISMEQTQRMTPSREAIGFPALALGEHDGEGILPHDQGPKEVGEGAGGAGHGGECL